MDSFKVLISFALLAACVYAVEIAEHQPLAPNPDGRLGPGVFPAGVPKEPSPIREKKQALYPYAYAAYPYSAYPYAAYPYSYSYQYYDDGKYYPGKYDGKAYARAGYPYYYPYYYY